MQCCTCSGLPYAASLQLKLLLARTCSALVMQIWACATGHHVVLAEALLVVDCSVTARVHCIP